MMFMMSDTSLHPFPLLADPASYQACDLDLLALPDRRAYWINHYRNHFPGLLEEAIAVEVHDGKSQQDAAARAAKAQAKFFDYLHSLEELPPVWHRQAVALDSLPVVDEPVATHHGQTAQSSGLPVPHGESHHTTSQQRLDILTIGRQRERILREHHFADPYRLMKEHENATALLALPALFCELDALPVSTSQERALRELMLIQGVFAGNIFDVGASETLALFKAGKIDFHQVRAKLKPRPWRIDHLDLWLHRLENQPPHQAAILFVDNSGCDVVLGMIPFGRALLKRNTQVIFAANTTPSLNDITATELTAMIRQIATWDPIIGEALSQERVEVIASGCSTPLIDLSQVSSELCEAAVNRGVDLVILEGMGRGVESNLEVKLTCEVMNLALVKDPDVARHINGQMYDQVMRYERQAIH